MYAFRKMALIQLKLYLREPMAMFFTLCVGPMLLVLMGIIFGNEPQELFNGLGQIDVSIPAYMALIVGMTGLTSVPISAAQRREAGVLRRFSATPLKPLVYFLADILAPFLVTLAGVALLVLLGTFLYHVRFVGNWLSIAAGVCLSTLAFFALGYALVGIIPGTRTVIVLGNVIVYPMVIFSGSTVPLEVMPETVQNIARFVPLRYVVTLLRGLWFGETWSAHLMEVAVLGGMFIVGMVIVALTFKWE